jgi:hypothetical protein
LDNKRYFRYSIKFARENLDSEIIRVVHGFLMPELQNFVDEDPWDNTQAMVWIESGRLVLFCDDRKDRKPIQKVDFEKKYQPTFVKRYSPIEVVRMFSRTGSYGPWSSDLMRRRPLLPDEDTVVRNKLRAARMNKDKGKNKVTVGALVLRKRKQDGAR